MTNPIGPEGAALVAEARRRAGIWREALGVLMDDWYLEDIALLTAEVERLTQAHEASEAENASLREALERVDGLLESAQYSPQVGHQYIARAVIEAALHSTHAPADERT